MLNTPICEMLGIKHPILQGGMAHISDAHLAAAVSNGGGLGIISAANGNVSWLSKQIDTARRLTDKPFGVNIMLMGENIDEIAKLVAEKKVAVVTTGAGNPEKYIPMWKEAGVKVIPVIASSALAKLVERSGADAVIAEGGESGGHVGEMTTMALVPQVCDSVNIPVIAAGGIADGRGMAAALMLGSVGVQIGTRFLAAYECNISREYKDKLLKANDTATIVTGRRLGHPVRSLKSPFSRGYQKAEYTSISDDELEMMAVGSLRAAVVDGDSKKGCFLAGQISGLVNKEENASDIINDIVCEAENILNGAKKMGKIAFVFSGQGSQYSGMGKSLYEIGTAAKKLYDDAEEVRPGTMKQSFEGTDEELKITANTQPCMYLVELAAALSLNEKGIYADGVAGFSLGEIGALAYAESYSYLDGFKIVTSRGQFMNDASDPENAAMCAVLKLDSETVTKTAAEFDKLYAVNYNCPGQTVVSGLKSSMPAFEEKVKELGGRCIPLAVSGAFHSPFMSEAAEKIEAEIANYAIVTPKIPVYANLTAKPYGNEIVRTLKMQMQSPVKWQETVENMIADGFTDFIEVGPGKTLSGLIKKISKEVNVYSVENAETLLETVEAVKNNA